ncbi:MAG: hypothetical protein IK119_09630 [Bacteroidales bacterium]|nr:hypothetical protein [Bacteroidales bacterium]
MSQSLIIHPEVAALQEQLEKLRQESSKLYLQAEYMQFEERPLLYSLYETNIGKLQFEEFQLSVKIRLVNLEAQLIQAYINRNERPDEHQIAERLRLEQEKFKGELDDKEAQIKAAQDYLNAPSYSKEETEELRNLYRIITKALHPDLHPEQTQKEHDLFLKAVSAYRMGDIHVLRQIALAITDEAIDKIPDDDLPSLIEKAQASVDAFKTRIDKMNKEFPFIYREQLKNEDWIKEQKVEISERISTARKTLEQKQQYLMMLKLWKPDSLS